MVKVGKRKNERGKGERGKRGKDREEGKEKGLTINFIPICPGKLQE